MRWDCKIFEQLSLTELFEIYRVRSAVFVEEQQIVVTDPDEQDKQAWHLFATEGERIIAYARLFVMNDVVTFGRVLTTKAVRGTGVGRELLHHLMQQITGQFPGMPIEIHAQTYATGFYTQVGFQPVGEPFLEAGVSHIKMVHPPL